MIIDTGRFIYFNKDSRLAKRNLLKTLGVTPKSYIGQVIIRIHDYFFKNSSLLRREFNFFYKCEFNTFQEYLERKHNLFKVEAEKLNHRNSFCSEKLDAEQYKVTGLLSGDYDDNIIREVVFKFLNIDELEESGVDYLYED